MPANTTKSAGEENSVDALETVPCLFEGPPLSLPNGVLQLKIATPEGEASSTRSVSPFFVEPTTEDLAYVDDVLSLWMSENGTLLRYPGFGERAVMLTVDGEVITTDPDTGFNSTSSTPQLDSDHTNEYSIPATVDDTVREGSHGNTLVCGHINPKRTGSKLETGTDNDLIKELCGQSQERAKPTSSSGIQATPARLPVHRHETDMIFELATISSYAFPRSLPRKGAPPTYSLHK